MLPALTSKKDDLFFNQLAGVDGAVPSVANGLLRALSGMLPITGGLPAFVSLARRAILTSE
jgi:hypothetical protein